MNLTVLNLLKGGLIVSCQASLGEPLCAPDHICALALSALNGGAVGLRLEGISNIELVRKKTKVPIIGLTKSTLVADAERLDQVYITATIEEARSLADAGADVISVDATQRPRPDNHSLEELVKFIHEELGKPVWADVSTFDEGIKAVAVGTDVLSTTLSGYTRQTETSVQAPPDFELLSRLVQQTSIPVALEGRVWQPNDVTHAFELGAYAVVVGSAITRPQLITKRFVEAIAKSKVLRGNS